MTKVRMCFKCSKTGHMKDMCPTVENFQDDASNFTCPPEMYGYRITALGRLTSMQDNHTNHG